MEFMRDKILIIDDDREIVDLLHSYLTLYGIPNQNILKAYDPVIGLNTFNENQHSIISVICDYYMPKASGAELCEIIKKNQPSTFLIIQSGDKEIKQENLNYVDAVIHKPFPYKKFEIILKQVFKV